MLKAICIKDLMINLLSDEGENIVAGVFKDTVFNIIEENKEYFVLYSPKLKMNINIDHELFNKNFEIYVNDNKNDDDNCVKNNLEKILNGGFEIELETNKKEYNMSSENNSENSYDETLNEEDYKDDIFNNIENELSKYIDNMGNELANTKNVEKLKNDIKDHLLNLGFEKDAINEYMNKYLVIESKDNFIKEKVNKGVADEEFELSIVNREYLVQSENYSIYYRKSSDDVNYIGYIDKNSNYIELELLTSKNDFMKNLLVLVSNELPEQLLNEIDYEEPIETLIDYSMTFISYCVLFKII